MDKDVTLIIKALCPVTLGGVEFWIDDDGPFAGDLSFDKPSEEWPNDQVVKDVLSRLSHFAMIHCTKDDEPDAVCMGWNEWCEYRSLGWSSTDEKNRIADAILASA